LLRLAAGSAISLLALVLVPLALGHPEHPTLFPTVAQAKAGGVPTYRTSGPFVVVCQPDSRPRLLAEWPTRRFRTRGGKRTPVYAAALRYRLRLLARCRFHSIQAAVNHARSGYRVLIMPGVYTEPASRAVPVGGYHRPPCANDYVVTEGFSSAPPPIGPASNDPPVRPDRNYLVDCPNSKFLIVVNGDPRHEPFPPHPHNMPQCFQLCNVQIEGMGRTPAGVLIQGDRRKIDVLRIDRANGVYLRNFTIEQGWFNDIDLVEVNGFVVKDIVARYAQDYGVLSFTTVNGLYDHISAYGNGDSGLYPGSAMKGCDVPDPNAYGTCADTGKPNAEGLPGRTGCQRYSIEIRNSDSYGNNLGYSGTAGNSTWVHDNKFHDNATGLATDSFTSGHPGFPQECFKWEHNQIYSNNMNEFTAERQDYCTKTPFEKRPKQIVCPEFQVPVGTGVIIAGGDRDLMRDNHIYDNWRQGVLLFYVPAAIRGDLDPSHQVDTSNGNQFIDNVMGVAPGGIRAPNGTDFVWDGQGIGNCWSGNTSAGGPPTSNPASLPGCFTGSLSPIPTNPLVLAAQVSCAAWDPETQHMPPGCDWFITPPKPQ
jgi:hypothetical protein